MTRHRRSRTRLLFLLLLPLCPACASVTAEHAKKVAAAGTAWGRATDALLLSAEEIAIDADSARVLSEGQGLAPDARRRVFEKHAGVAQGVADFERLRRHARLLTRYFARLGDLSDPAVDRAADEAASRAAGAAAELGRELSGSALLTSSERDLLGRTAALSVRGVREHALARELEARGAAIAHELLVQQTLLEAVRRRVRADAASAHDLGMQRDVARPYWENAVADPPGWIALRRRYTLPHAVSDALADAGDTASRLRAAWAALAEGRLDAAAWSALLADAETLASFASAVRDVRR
jgi:hypothetical protein